MKKLLSLAAIVTIVMSAFAFTTKNVGTFLCIYDEPSNSCIITNDFQTTTGLGEDFYWTSFEFGKHTALDCAASNCPTSVRLIPN